MWCPRKVFCARVHAMFFMQFFLWKQTRFIFYGVHVRAQSTLFELEKCNNCSNIMASHKRGKTVFSELKNILNESRRRVHNVLFVNKLGTANPRVWTFASPTCFTKESSFNYCVVFISENIQTHNYAFCTPFTSFASCVLVFYADRKTWLQNIYWRK